jgi:hypothetical protein
MDMYTYSRHLCLLNAQLIHEEHAVERFLRVLYLKVAGGLGLNHFPPRAEGLIRTDMMPEIQIGDHFATLSLILSSRS